MENKKQDKSKLAGVILTVTLVICCVALFIMSEQGSKLVNSFASPSDETVDKSDTDIAKLTCERFVSAAVNNGLNIKLNKVSETERVVEYELVGENCEGKLLLSMADGAVNAFTLCFTMPCFTDEESKTDSDAKSLLTERDGSSYSEYIDWFTKLYAPLAFALDDKGALSYAHMDAAVNNLRNALGEDIEATDIKGEFRQVISLREEEEMCSVSISLEKTPSK